ncbi:PIN domain-like protein [Suillus fuscotomentosus]|uniref:PIN domain-like protein n=1 Tax=Suillus fuscotomentosus TaxID=1912939 RepID=A0AAD4DNW1_9AGAM|nr:PIN domain-like protein [Suillus fuscotomentosus]KAG1886936.1 PIN domain-like protein [Suillus fuscotomentosus]
MGINNLWELLEPAAKTVHITSLALQDRYVGPAPHLPYMIGVDTSGWFEQCQQGNWHRAHTQTGQNPALRTFLFCLARLTQFPVQLVFCYDGNQRPDVKQGHKVSSREHWMVKPTQRILDVFHTQWITAAGEAEAQLALMNSADVIDAVLTDDSDIFVFGVKTVLRNSTLSMDTIKIYTASAIQDKIDHRLTGDAFITMAICCGGDYDKASLITQAHVTSLAELAKLQLPASPDLAQLASVIQQFLGWDSKKLLNTFHTTIWPVVILHELLEDLANNSPRSDELSLASGCTRAVFLNRVSRPQKTLVGISGHNTDVPTDMLEKTMMQLLEEPALGCQDDITSSHKYVRVWLADRIYDCWVKTMFLSSSGDLCTKSSLPSTSHAVHQLSVYPVSNSGPPASSSMSIIDLTEDEDAMAFAGGAIIDLTGDDDSELIDLTL